MHIINLLPLAVIDIKEVFLVLLVLGAVGVGAWLVNKYMPWPWSLFPYIVLGVVAFYVTFRFIQGM